jgi:hypothetical protein
MTHRQPANLPSPRSGGELAECIKIEAFLQTKMRRRPFQDIAAHCTLRAFSVLP